MQTTETTITTVDMQEPKQEFVQVDMQTTEVTITTVDMTEAKITT